MVLRVGRPDVVDNDGRYKHTELVREPTHRSDIKSTCGYSQCESIFLHSRRTFERCWQFKKTFSSHWNVHESYNGWAYFSADYIKIMLLQPDLCCSKTFNYYFELWTVYYAFIALFCQVICMNRIRLRNRHARRIFHSWFKLVLQVFVVHWTMIEDIFSCYHRQHWRFQHSEGRSAICFGDAYVPIVQLPYCLPAI